VRRLIVEAAAPEHEAAQLRSGERQFPDFDRIGAAEFLRDLAAERGHHVKAIKDRHEAAFGKAYADLTSACNACHQALNHAVVAIEVPQSASVFDLDLMPAKP
jgi:hypothetical protein